ncbi:MAG TPA: Gfo/Idh/MocA family oxidoreductase [Cyclobacteriaceae bacterium]|nr:Gfo/Idh/MocA family oxidoreductase [Cyclobacteriaceae bacterium]
MKDNNTRRLSRRSFLEKSAVGLAGVTIFPRLMGCSPKSTESANGNLNLGFIGMGQQSMFLLRGFMGIEGVRAVAGSDVYGIKRQRFEKRVTDFYSEKGIKSEVKTYEKYQDLLAREDIDAVVIAVPDHWHALIAIDALKAGKDVYLEKPLTLTIKEGMMLRSAVRKYNRILGVGSQQRSDPNFQAAVKLVQEGKIGQLEKINAYVGAPPKPYDLPEEPVPSDLNWDLWLGPNPYVHYNKELNPPITLEPEQNEQFWGGWRWYKELGGGFTTDWGAHMFDIAQWGLQMDNSGPVEITPAGYQDFKFLTYKYQNGVIMTEEPFNAEMTKGVKFWGKDGWIEISREFFKASNSELVSNAEKESGPYETKIPHQQNFIEAVKNRKDPVVPVEIGHRSCTVCTLGNISYELGRPVKWDPEKESFGDDAESNALLHRTYREGYQLPIV